MFEVQSVIEILSKTEEFFRRHGVPSPKLDAQLLLAHALGCKRLELFLRYDEPVVGEALEKMRDFARRRGRREPLQHIIGFQDFFGVRIKCDGRALIPRPETEELCEILTEKYFPDKSAQLGILDMGTGSGAIAVALAKHYPNARVSASDASAKALSLASENAQGNGVKINFIESDWFENVGGSYDLIVSNPPYLTEEEVASAEPEVREYDPMEALVSGDGGLADIKKILAHAAGHLSGGGVLALECGLWQAEKAAASFADFGFAGAETFKDASKRVRFAIFRARG